MKDWTLRRKLKTIWVSGGITFLCWIIYSMQAQNVDQALLQSDDFLLFENTNNYYAYTPSQDFKEVVIFYPGALVETKAYIPLCKEIAQQNIKVYLIKMPWRQAALGYKKTKELNLLNDASKKYSLIGHSQGGKMAAQFVYENPDLIDKLILIGTTHPRDISLSNYKIPIMKIYGSNDGIANEIEIIKNKSKLPPHTNYVRINGGNHSQFGYYGFQLGDHKAKIDRQQQQAQTLKNIIEFVYE